MTPLVLVGDRAVIAVGAEPERSIDAVWVFGRFCLWASGHAIGEPEDVVTLRAVVAWWRDFVADGEPRWDMRLAGLEAGAAFDLLHRSVFGDEQPEEEVPNAFRFFVGQLGMSAFDAYDVVLLDDPCRGQRLIWRHRGGPVQEVVLEPAAMQRIGRAFLEAWADAELPT